MGTSRSGKIREDQGRSGKIREDQETLFMGFLVCCGIMNHKLVLGVIMFKTMTSALDTRKAPSDEEISKIPSYIFCRWLSGNPNSIFAANMINQFHEIPIENQYWMVKKAFSGKIKFIPYPKQEKEETEKSVQNISDYFKISTEKARDYLDMISPDELKFIQSLYL